MEKCQGILTINLGSRRQGGYRTIASSRNSPRPIGDFDHFGQPIGVVSNAMGVLLLGNLLQKASDKGISSARRIDRFYRNTPNSFFERWRTQ